MQGFIVFLTKRGKDLIHSGGKIVQMLPVNLTKILYFSNPSAGLEHLNSRTILRHLIDTRNLVFDKDGTLSHRSTSGAVFSQISLTDVALKHANSLAGIPQTYGSHIDPILHADSLNRLFSQIDASVTVVIESEKNDPDKKRVAAILPGGSTGIPHATILERFEFWGLNTEIHLYGGCMEVHFGTPALLEVFPEDYIQFTGFLQNLHWGDKAVKQSKLEASIFWKRLICSNGAYLRKVLASGRLMSLASKEQAVKFVDLQIKRTLSIEKDILKSAVEVMSNTIPTEQEYEDVAKLISRLAGKKKAEELLATTVSWWDNFNAVTAAANQVENLTNVRKLQIEGGAMLERFLHA